MNPKTPWPRNWFKRFAVALAVTGVIGQVLAAFVCLRIPCHRGQRIFGFVEQAALVLD
ncbi:MAG: hypothetical protein KKD96_07500 [Proteobacteria bacterium]|nr:hypothetical protein [Pseudomonadota bacterium]